MKKAILTLTVTAFIVATTLTICQSSAINIENTQDKTTLAKQELYQTLNDSLQQFNKESNIKIGNYETSIGEYKTRITNEKIDNIARYEKKIAELGR